MLFVLSTVGILGHKSHRRPSQNNTLASENLFDHKGAQTGWYRRIEQCTVTRNLNTPSLLSGHLGHEDPVTPWVSVGIITSAWLPPL